MQVSEFITESSRFSAEMTLLSRSRVMQMLLQRLIYIQINDLYVRNNEKICDMRVRGLPLRGLYLADSRAL